MTLRSIGANGGQAAAFTFDLARSVVYTRQGNPAWAGQDRDDDTIIRSNDLFYGAASFDPQPDWVDMSKVAIPQADEQQRLLGNLIIQMNLAKKPLPRLWYFPNSVKAVVIMTGDDHGNNGTAGRFDHYMALSPLNCAVENWECIRATSYYAYNDALLSLLTDTQAAVYASSGFEISAHINTDCSDWTPVSLEAYFANQLSEWSAEFPSLPAPVTNRVHCITWSDYTTMPVVELNHGIRLDTTYYYYPQKWVNDRPGFFTGSGMPMRFADADGNLINVYQAVTQMTDESGQTYPYTINSLLDKANGPEGYFGAFTANIHNDTAESPDSDDIIASAIAHGVPVVSARQMLTWLDGRNASRFTSIAWNGNTLSFSISAGQGTSGLMAMVPASSSQRTTQITLNGNPVGFTTAVIKGIQYAVFPATAGSYQITYESDIPWPMISSTAASPTRTSPIPVTVTFSESVTGFTSSDVTVANGTIGAFAGAGTTYTFNVTPIANGVVTIDIAAGAAQDSTSNPSNAAVQFRMTYDNVQPTVTISSIASNPTGTSPIPVTVAFSEPVMGFVAGDVTIGNGTISSFASSGSITYTFNVTPTASGTVTVDIAAGVAQDAAGNTNTAAVQLTRTYNATAPTVTISSTASNPTSTSPIPVTVTFSEPVTGFEAGDVTIGNGTIGSVLGSGATYSFNVTPTANGVVTVDIAAGVAQDAAGNTNTAAVQFTQDL